MARKYPAIPGAMPGDTIAEKRASLTDENAGNLILSHSDHRTYLW